MSLLAVRDAHKSFAATAALRGASLALDAGELVFLPGPNGAAFFSIFLIAARRLARRWESA